MGGDHLNWCPVIYIPVYSIRVLNYVSSGKQFLEYHVKQVPADEVNTQLIFPSKPESQTVASAQPQSQEQEALSCSVVYPRWWRLLTVQDTGSCSRTNVTL